MKYLVTIKQGSLTSFYLMESPDKQEVVQKLGNLPLFGNTLNSIEIKELTENYIDIYFLIAINQEVNEESERNF